MSEKFDRQQKKLEQLDRVSVKPYMSLDDAMPCRSRHDIILTIQPDR